MRQSSLVVVANRLPIDDSQAPDGACEWRRSPGGLVSALHPLLRHTPATWVGWAGGTGPAPALPDVDGVRMHTVALSPEDLRDHYEGFANATLWPLYHDAVEQPQHHRRWWEAYQRVNQRFAEATAEVAEPGGVVWVQDYHLQLVPGLLRALRPDLRIGFFLHVPFPPPELFMQLPRRAELLRGMLGADLVGFQRVQAAHNFAQLVTRVLELPATDRRIGIDDRVVRIGAFPVSIDTAEMAALAARPDVAARAHRLRQDLGDPRQVILSVDRMDYTKGIEQRLKAYSELLASGDVKVRDTVLVQVAMPSRERVGQYQILRERIEREVGRINGEFGRVGEPAIHYLTQPFDRAELAALYRVADVMAVTPLRDGMNLVAKEYVAARVDDTGALLLSEFAGTAAELSQAYLVNPHDLEGLKQGLRAALRADPADTTQRMRAMRAHLHQHDIRAWARSYLRALDEGGALISRLTSTDTGSDGAARVPRPATPGRQPGHPPGRRLTAGRAARPTAQCAAAGSFSSQSRIASIGSAHRASSIRSWPIPGKSSGADPYRRATRVNVDAGTTRSSGLPSTSTGGAPTAGSASGSPSSAHCARRPARPRRPTYRRASSSGSSRLNNCPRLSRSGPPNTAGSVPAGLRRNAAPSTLQPPKTGATSTAPRAG